MELVTDPRVIEGYLVDASNTRGHAEALARPRTAEEVAEVVAQAQARGVPLTVTAQRTSTTGAPVPRGGWLLSTERLDRVLDLDEAEGGVILGQLQDRVEAAGRLFPPDPTSRHECSLGAAIACNASGARSFRYGPTRPWVEAVQWVLPSGEIVEADRSTPVPAGWPVPAWQEPGVKTAAGFFPADNLLDLLIGSEGTLGVLTRARLRLTALPTGVLALVAFWAERAPMLAFVEAARAEADRARSPRAEPGPLDPQAMEYFDPKALQFMRERVPEVPAEARHALFLEIPHSGEPPLEAWWEALEAHEALVDDVIVAEDDRGRRKLHAVRHAVPAGINERVVANGMPKVGTDFAVPDAALAPMLDAYEAVAAETGIETVNFGHIGDNHLHLNLLPTSPAELALAKQIYRRLAHRAVALGGTVSAEHGIGKLKRELLADMVGPEVLAGFRALKTAVDPGWILGRGTLLAPPGDAPG